MKKTTTIVIIVIAIIVLCCWSIFAITWTQKMLENRNASESGLEQSSSFEQNNSLEQSVTPKQSDKQNTGFYFAENTRANCKNKTI